MALIDNQLMLSDAQDLTVTANSTNVIDLGTGRNLGSDNQLVVFFQFGTVVSNATWQCNMTGADNAAMSTNKITIVATKTITPVSSTYLIQPIPPHPLKQFIRGEYTMASGSSPHIPTTMTIVRDAERHLYLAGAAALY